MSTFVRALVRRPKLAIAVWLVPIALLVWQAGSLESRLAGSTYTVDGTEYKHAKDLTESTFGPSTQFPILLTGPREVLDRRGPVYAERLERRAGTSVLSPWDGGSAAKNLRPRGEAAMLIATVDVAEEEWLETAADIEHAVDATVKPPLRAHITGQATIGLALEEETIKSSEKAELLALPMLLIVLLLVFRSVIAAAIPALFGALMVATSWGILAVLATFIDLAASALFLSSMMGLALGVDYSLLIVARFREELAAGNEQGAAEAALRSALTAGRTVAYAGITLATATLGGLLLAPGSFLVAAVAGVVVAATVSAVSAIIAIPAVLTLLGTRIDKLSIGRRRPRDGARGSRAGDVAARALKRPALAALLVLLPLLALSGLAGGLDPGTPGADMLTPDMRAHKDLETITRVMGPGWSAPFELVAMAEKGPVTEKGRLRKLARLQRTLARSKGVDSVIGPGSVRRATSSLNRLSDQTDGLKKTLSQGRRDVDRLDNGLSRAEGGVREVRSGLSRAAAGADRLAAGGKDARDGSRQIADGVAQARRGTARLVSALRDAERGGNRVAKGADEAATGARKIENGLAEARAGVTQAMPKTQELESGLRSGASDLTALREPAQIAQRELDKAYGLLERMRAGKLDPNYRAAIEAVGTAKSAVSGRHAVTGAPVREGYDGLDASLATGSSELERAASGVAAAGRDTRELVAGLTKLEQGAGRLSNGLGRLRSGGDELADGLERIRREVGADVDDIARLARGARELERGIGRLASGSSTLRDGLADGRRRSSPLEDGLDRMGSAVGGFELPKSLGTERLERTSPGFFDSGHIVLAALDGARSDAREQAEAVVSVGAGGRAARIFVIPTTGSTDPRTAALYERLKGRADRFEQTSGMETAVGGQAALVLDYDEAVSDRLIVMIVGLAIITYLVLIPFLRALLLPLVAVALNVLTVAATFGVLVLCFQGDAPLGGPGYIDSIVALGIFGVVFGLSIDYEVFLLGRMREGWLRSRDSDAAIAHGLDRTASVVTGAAAIMLAVFVAFTITDFPGQRQFGVGLVVAVILDATVVRLVLLPAAMKLMGPAAWWIPGWLDRILPRLDEGEDELSQDVDEPRSRVEQEARFSTDAAGQTTLIGAGDGGAGR